MRSAREILGDRWARDHAGDKKPVLAAALETAFDPAKSDACIGLDQAARDQAAAWLPPGMAYDADTAKDIRSIPARTPRSMSMMALTAEIEAPLADLPDFLTEDALAVVNRTPAL